MRNIIVQGLGFVGSAMAVAIASKVNDKGNPIFNVIGIDLDNDTGKNRIESINAGVFPFKTNDKKISTELKRAYERGNLKATYDNSYYKKADVVLVNINCDLIIYKNNESIDLKSFKKSIHVIAENISENTLVIIESTVPPGTCSKIIYPLFKKIFKDRGLNFNNLYLAHSYERVMPGKKYFDSIINYWRVYSGINKESSRMCRVFLNKFINTEKYPLTCLNNTVASETAKLLENSYRAVNIAFMEEWGRFAEDSGIDLFEVIDAIRIRPTHSNMRQPGFGVGGYCLTKDPLFAKIAAKEILNLNNHEFPFSTKAIQVNKRMPYVTFDKLKNYFNYELKNKKILLMGATYRHDVGDTRFSPSETFVKECQSQGIEISVYDPMIEYWAELDMNTEFSLPSINDYDAIVFAVAHKEFALIDINKWITNKNTLLLDANNVLTKKQIIEINKNKLNYLSIGRG